MTVLSFKQAVLKEAGVGKEKKAPAKKQQPKLRSSQERNSNSNSNRGDASANGVVVAGAETPESLVLLKLRCVHRRGASQSQSQSQSNSNSTNGSEDSDDTDFVALDGPVADECYVEAKLLDVSSSRSTSRCVTDSDSEGSREASSGGLKATPQGMGMSSSNSSCAIYSEDTDDNYSDSTANGALAITRSSTPEAANANANANANKGKDNKAERQVKKEEEGDDGNKKKLYIKIPETPASLVAPAQGQAQQVYTPLGSVSPGFTVHTPNEYNFVYPNTPHQKVTVELDCPQALVGRLIGKNGSTVRNLELKTGVSIQIDQSLPDGCPRRVKICGHPQLIDHAERIVEEVIKHGPPELNKRNVYKMELNAIAYEQAQAKAQQANKSKRNLFAKVFKQMQGPHAATSFATTTPKGQQQRHQRKKFSNATAMNHPSPPQTYYPVGVGEYEYEAVAPLHAAPGYLPVPHYTLPYANNMYVPEVYPSPAAHYIPQVVKPRSFKVYATAALAAGRMWSQHQSPTGQKYFLNHVTGKVTNLEDD